MAQATLYGKVAPGEFYRKAGARLTEDADPSQIAHKVDTAERTLPLLQAYHSFDKAHVVMLCEEGLIPRDDATAILRAFREMEAAGWEQVRREGGHGLFSGEAYLIEKLGEEIGGQGSDLSKKVFAERRAGKNLVDVAVGGGPPMILYHKSGAIK